jgi:hypothetical protein
MAAGPRRSGTGRSLGLCTELTEERLLLFFGSEQEIPRRRRASDRSQ